MWAMARRRLHPRARMTLAVGGGVLVVLAIVLAFLRITELAAIVVLLTGILLLVFAAIGELPEEIGVRSRRLSRPHDPARDYRKGVYDAVRAAVPDLQPPQRAPDWQPGRPAYQVQELGLRVVVAYARDPSYRVDPSVLATDGGTLLVVTNVTRIADLQLAMRSSGVRGAVVRWRSPAESEAVHRAIRDLSTPEAG
jgi:hypothetical protein